MLRFFLYVIVLIVLPASLRADDWPQFLGPRRDGVSLEKGLLDAFPKSGPKVVWQRDVGEGFSGIVTSGERAIVFHFRDPGPGFRVENLDHAAISNPEDDPLGHDRVREELGLRRVGNACLPVHGRC